MKKYHLIAILGLAAVSAALAQSTLNELRASSVKTEAQILAENRKLIISQAMKDEKFYEALKQNNWIFDDIKITDSQITQLLFNKKEFQTINPALAARVYSTINYKEYIAARVSLFGNNTIAAYDWLQEQRLTLAQAQNAPGYNDKQAFLEAIATQVLAAARAKGQ